LARENGASVLRLETNRALEEAIGLYRAAGFAEVAPFNDEPYAHHWFEKVLS
jgi:ribosomal protein S18 acetylase RimI-like enzyme